VPLRSIAVAVAVLAAVPLVARKLPEDQQIEHALNRLTFGPRPDYAKAVSKLGLKKWVDLQLHPERIPENPVLTAKLAPLETLRMSNDEIAQNYGPADPQARRRVARDLQEAKIYRAVYSNRQFVEVLTDFWFNHFNVFLDKGADRYLTTEYERDAIRPHVLGKFRDLLEATAKSPAMLFYLDNWQSVSPDTPAGRRRRGLNENYARELLELHTLGVDGGYTQKDIIEVARCFTGWTIAEPRRGGRFFYNDRVHDKGEKLVLGVKIGAGGGMDDGLKVLDIIAHHPSTATFISRQIAQRFVADNPPPALVKAMAETFRKSDGNLREVMRTMLRSREFWSEDAYRAKVKSPFEMVISALRATDADVTSGFGVAQQIAKLGQPLYRKQEPTGYPNDSAEWVNSASLLGRMNFAVALASNKLPGVSVGQDVSATTFGSPDFQRK